MADLYYYEAGYIDEKYFGYVADAAVDLTTYIEDGYIDISYYIGYGSESSLACEATKLSGQTVEANGSWSSEFAQSATALRTAPSAAILIVDTAQSVTVTRIIDVTATFDGVWSSSLTAIAYKNHTAVLDIHSTMTTDVVVNRSANILLEHIANLNSMAAKTAVFSSNQTITASQTAQSQKTASGQSSLAVSAVQTTNPQYVQLASAALSADSSVFVSRNAYKSRPILLVDSDPRTDYAKYGSYSQRITSQARTYSYPADIRIGNSTQFVIEGWYRHSYYVGTSGYHIIMYEGAGTGITSTNVGQNQWVMGVWADGTTYRIRLLVKNSSNQTITIDSATSSLTNFITVSSWNHYAVTRDSNQVFKVYWNGTEKASGTVSTIGTATEYRVGFSKAISGDQYGYWDELSYRKGTSTIAGLNSGISDDPATQVFLFHFEGNSNDDTSNSINITQSGSATLSADVTISAQANPNTKSVVSSQSSSVSLSVSATKVVSATASESCEFAQTTDGLRVRYFDSQQSVVFDQSSTVGVIKQFDSQTLTGFTTSMAVEAILRPGVYLESEFAQTTAAVKTTDSSSTYTVSASMSADGDRTASLVSNLSLASTILITADRIRSTELTLALDIEISAVGNKIPPFSSDLSTTATITVEVTKFKRTSAGLAAEFTTPDIKVHHKANGVASLAQAFFIETVTGTRIRFADSAQSVTVAQTASAVKTTDVALVGQITVAQTASAVKTTDVLVDNLVLFGSSIDADLTARPLVYLESTTAVSALIGVIRQLELRPVYGVTFAKATPYVEYTDSNTLPQILAQGQTISFWMRKENADSFGYIINSQPGPYPNWRLSLIYENSSDLVWENFALTAPNQDTELRWSNSIPNDYEWHHYFLILDPWPSSGSFGTRWYIRLYRDGQYISTQQTPGGSSGGGINYWWDNLQFGANKFTVSDNQIGQITLAQVWIGNLTHVYTNDQSNWISSFYDDGYVVLSSTGQVGAVTPFVYEEFRPPYGVKITAGSGSLTTYYGGYPLDGIGAITRLAAQPVINAFLTQTDLPAASTLTADADYTAGPNQTITVTATVSAVVNQFIGIVSAHTSTTTVTCEISKITGYASADTVTATLTATAGFFELAQANVTDQFDLVADFDAIPPTRGEAELSSGFTITVNAQSYTDATSLHLGTFTVTTEVTVIEPIRTTADLAATTALTVIIGEIEQFAALTVSTGQMITTAVKTARPIADLTATATVVSAPVKYTGIVANWQGFASTLTLGDIINFDPYLTLIISAESRGLIIWQESRENTIESETRVNII